MRQLLNEHAPNFLSGDLTTNVFKTCCNKRNTTVIILLLVEVRMLIKTATGILPRFLIIRTALCLSWSRKVRTVPVEWSDLNKDMCKFESSQKDESRAQSADTSKAVVLKLWYVRAVHVLREHLSCHIRKALLIRFCVIIRSCVMLMLRIRLIAILILSTFWAKYVLLKPGVYTPTLKKHQMVCDLKKFENHCSKAYRKRRAFICRSLLSRTIKATFKQSSCLPAGVGKHADRAVVLLEFEVLVVQPVLQVLTVETFVGTK